jgi:simple sugar transport system substrate-binding protein
MGRNRCYVRADRGSLALETEEGFVDSDQPLDEQGAAPIDPEAQHEVAMDRRNLLKRVGLGAAALSVPTAVMASPAMGAVTNALAADSFIKSHPKWKFVFVNHVTTNPFFVPTIYGAQDACSLLGCSYQWTGSTTSDVSQMVNAFNSAISAKAAGISCCLVDLKAFNGPTSSAIAKGIPVLAYNADVPAGNPNERLAYIGQDLFASGFAMGQRIVNLVGEGEVALFIATPGQLNIQPRIDGATAAIKKYGKGKIKTSAIATGSQLNDEIAKINAYYLGHKNVKGMFAVDAGSTQAVGQTVAKYGLRKKGVKAGGYDLTPTTLKLIQSNQLDFTIDQQPYLQGWLPVLQLFFYRYSSGLVAPSNTNTGILFVTKANVKPYISTKTRYEGSSSAQKYPVS